MRSYTSKTKSFASRDSLRKRTLGYMGGQMAVVFALAAVTLCGVIALGADVGVLYYNWVQLQKAADAAALAGAQILDKTRAIRPPLPPRWPAPPPRPMPPTMEFRPTTW